MPDPRIRILFVRRDAPKSPGDVTTPVTPQRLVRALNTLALCLAREALLSPEERAQRAEEIAAFVRRQLGVVEQAARRWPSCTPAFPSVEEAQAGILPSGRLCPECTCWRRHYEAWKTPMAPAWWPNAERAERRELGRWVRHQVRLARGSSPTGTVAGPAQR